MNLIVWVIMLGVLVYTIGFSIQLWKEQNKVGSIAVFILALSATIAPFFSFLRW